jgi:hypothetical protein
LTTLVRVSDIQGRTDLETLFGEDAMLDVLRFVESTGVDKKLTDGTNKCDSWKIERLDRVGDEKTTR